MNRFFTYVDPTNYELSNEGLMKACVAEVVAEAEDSGNYPMCDGVDLLKSANYLYLDVLNDISQLVEAHLGS